MTETWSGVLNTDGGPLRLKLVLEENGSASLLSVDQTDDPTPGHYTSSDGNALNVEFPDIGGVYVGRLASGGRIEGRWRQGGGDLELVFYPGEAALADPQAIPFTNERLAELRADTAAPAIAAAAARLEAPPQVWVDGERAIGSGVAVRKLDVWHLGSITKSMTSTLVGRLVDLGAVHWDETVGDLLRNVAPRMRTAYAAASFRHLLSHRSGIPRDVAPEDLDRFSFELADARYERQEYARIALSMAPIGRMETTFEYSNCGYVVAGAMLEAKLGDSWENLVTAHVFEPLGLSTAGFGAPGYEGRLDQPLGHGMMDNALQAFAVGEPGNDNPVVIGPAGRVHMSLQDLLRYLAVHRDRTPYLKPDTWDTLHTTPFGGDYAMGWVVREDGGLWHNGSNGMWYAEALIDAGGEIVAAAVVNDGDQEQCGPAVSQALQEAAASLYE